MTPLFKKLNFKDHKNIVVLQAPKSMDAELQIMQNETTISTQIKKLTSIDFVIFFTTQQTELNNFINSNYTKLAGDAVLWICFPKGTSKNYTCNFNRDTGWQEFGKYNLEPVRSVAIDADWTALRFRKIEYIKKFTREAKYAISQVGKAKSKISK